MPIGKRLNLTPEVESKIREEYERGSSLREVAATFNVSPPTVTRSILHAGGTIRPNSNKKGTLADDVELVKSIADDYINGKPIDQIKKDRGLKVASSSILDAFRRNNIPIRTSGKQRVIGVTPKKYNHVPFSADTEKINKVAEEYAKGKSIQSIIQDMNLGVSESTVLNALNKHEIQLRKGGAQRAVDAYINKEGYRIVRIYKGDPMWSMARLFKPHHNSGTVYEHRLVLARKLGRPMQPHETVHHLNGDKQDNRPENLELRVGNHGKGASRAHCASCSCF